MSFDRLAPHYRWLEAALAGGKLQRGRLVFLNRVRQSKNALLVGEGPGRFLCPFLAANPNAGVLCLDASREMLRRAEFNAQRAGMSLSRVEFLHADILTWQPHVNPFDLIVTHFFLDCFRPDQLAEIISRLAVLAGPDAIWLLADFTEPAKGLSRWRARLILRVMYGFFRLTTSLPGRNLTPPDPFLADQGFFLSERVTSEWGLLHSDLWMRIRSRLN